MYRFSLFAIWIITAFFPGLPKTVAAQEIPFSDYGDYTLIIEELSLGDLEFEGSLQSGGGIYRVELPDAFVLSVIGNKHLDVGVQIQGDGTLYLDGNPEYADDPQRSISFTLRSAYANQGENNISDAIFIPVSSDNHVSDRFPVLGRQHLPPGPPPPPPTEGQNPSEYEETAYLYLYGEIDVGPVAAGNYRGSITVTVEYE